MKVKVANLCWKKSNEHILMYFNHKQCEIMQNKSMKRLKRPTSMTLQGDVRSSLLKTALYDENSEN